jgi:hypothetical protein
LGISGIPVKGKKAPVRTAFIMKKSTFDVCEPVGVVHAAVAYFINESGE